MSNILPEIKSLLQEHANRVAARKLAKIARAEAWEREAIAFIERSPYTVFVNMRTGDTVIRPTYRMITTPTGRTVRHSWPSYRDVSGFFMGSESGLEAIHLFSGGKKRAELIAYKINWLCQMEKVKPTRELIHDVVKAVKP